MCLRLHRAELELQPRCSDFTAHALHYQTSQIKTQDSRLSGGFTLSLLILKLMKEQTTFEMASKTF